LREVRSPDGVWCWKERETKVVRTPRHCFNVLQYYELWSINVTLQSYYGWVGGWGVGTTATAVGVGSAAAAPVIAQAQAAAVEAAAEAGIAGIAGGSAAYAGAGAAVTYTGLAAFGFGVFYLGTSVMRLIDNNGEELVAAGWDIVARGFDTGTPSAPEVVWERCTPVQRCRVATGGPGTGHGVGGHGGNPPADDPPPPSGPEGQPGDGTGFIPGTVIPDERFDSPFGLRLVGPAATALGSVAPPPLFEGQVATALPVKTRTVKPAKLGGIIRFE
jgi:hypothetical protein